ncbi:MAG: hypothetical protein HYZ44_01195, partial [Bacteroidetes bacterium]|nr:hypothetical protein [Bacteroidota bacterium]
MKLSLKIFIMVMAVSSFLNSGCSDSATTPNTTVVDAKSSLTDITNGVIIPTYKDMYVRAQTL